MAKKKVFGSDIESRIALVGAIAGDRTFGFSGGYRVTSVPTMYATTENPADRVDTSIRRGREAFKAAREDRIAATRAHRAVAVDPVADAKVLGKARRKRFRTAMTVNFNGRVE